MGNGAADARGFGGFGRRGMLRRGSGADSPSNGTSSTQLNALALLAETHGASGPRNEMNNPIDRGPTMLAPPPRGSSRRNRIEDLEEMMLMEAIRLSLASEEERKRKEDKEAKKDAKKKGKEMKKAEKAAKKGVGYSSSANPSSLGLDGIVASPLEENPNAQDKGKGIDRSRSGTPSVLPDSQTFNTGTITSSTAPATANQEHYLDHIRAQLQTSDAHSPASLSGSEPQKPSHLRQISNVSSSASSFAESAPSSLKNGLAGSSSSLDVSPNTSELQIQHGDNVSDTPGSATPGGGAGTESMFNFRSLAAMIDDEEKEDRSVHIEDVHHQGNNPDENNMSQSSRHESPEVIHEGNRTTLEQSTVTLKASGVLQGPLDNGTVETPDVMVTSPSETSLHCKDNSTSNGTDNIGGLESEPSEYSHPLLS